MNRTMTIVVLTLAVVLILGLSAVFLILLREVTSPVTTVENTPIPTATTGATSAVAALPPPVVEVLPTNTPLPTDTPTNTPLPTDTPEPTPTPEPSATNTPIPPVVIRSTNTPIPQPTSTSAPPPPPPADTHGLTASHFAIQPRAVLSVNQPVWFEFNIANAAGGPVPFGALGVMPRQGGTDRNDWVQISWGGNNDSIPQNGLSWEDNIRIPQAGSYTLRVVICFSDFNACKAGGPWVTLSQEIPVTIN
jgi:hypothetical protein